MIWKNYIMLSNVNDGIIRVLERNNIIDEEDAPLYAYGLRSFWMIAITTISILLIGIILNELLFTVGFISLFAVIRKYSGGYHAKSRVVCYILSNAVVVGIIYINKTLLWIQNDSIWGMKCTILVLSMAIVILATYIRYDKKGRTITVVGIGAVFF